MVCSIGYNPQRLPRGYSLDDIDIRLVISNLCVMDWGGANHQLRVVSLHPGVSFDEVQDNTSFDLAQVDNLTTTPAPTAEQMAIMATLDPANSRAKQLKDNPVGDRRRLEESNNV